MSSSETVRVVERGEAGDVTLTYVENVGSGGKSRVDTVLPAVSKSYTQQLIDVFLPAGYPHSVTDDYIQYQIFDSLQAFSSSIASMLSSRAVLQGVGVGDASASPTAALLLNVLQESMGRVATILFAHKLGTSLEPECKMYRLAADVFNDCAMVLDCLSPAFPKPARVTILSFSSVLRSLCGVCAGSSKATLSAHFAKRGNLGEVNAKDSSQETVISLLGMLAGSVVVSWISTPMATWTALLTLISMHLATNYAAVKSVSMQCLNRQRANIVLSNMMQSGRILSPAQVSQRERIFERDGVLRWADDVVIGHCHIGVSMQTLVRRMGIRISRLDGQQADSDQQVQGSSRSRSISISVSDLLRVFEEQSFILWSSDTDVVIVLKQGCTPIDQLKAWALALLLCQKARLRRQAGGDAKTTDDTCKRQLAVLKLALDEAGASVDACEARLREAGWDLTLGGLETWAGKRIQIETKKRV